MENNVPYVYLLGKTYLTNNEKFYIRNDPVTHMAAGDRHTIIVTESGRVYAFGDNNSGQLGLGHTDAIDKVSCIKSLKFDETGEKVLLAACGCESSLVATNCGSLYVFGSNHYCQLSIESEELITIYPYPVKIEHFGSKISWKQLSMGAKHTCALTNDGKVYVWGSNEDGQCGLARKYDIIRTPRQLRLEYPVIAISCGYYHTALISENGRLFLFGNNSDRQLGRTISNEYVGPLEVSLPDPIKAVACGNQHTVILTEKGEVYTCGRGDRGQLGLGRRVTIAKHFERIENLPKHLTAIAAGEAHTAVVDFHGQIYGFGDGKHGKLSSESHSNKFKPYLIEKFPGHHVLKVVCGSCQTIILAQSIENEEDIENITSSKIKLIKSLIHINLTKSLDELSNKNNSSLYSESISDSDKLSISTKCALMNTTHVEINGKFQPQKTSFSTSNLRINQNSDDEISSSEERLILISNHRNSLDQNDDQCDFKTSSSTTSGRTSSSISSVQNETPAITSKSTDDLRNNCHSSKTKTGTQSYLINSNIDSKKNFITPESRSGLISRFFGKKPLQNLSKTTNGNSKICSMM